jgi:very-short-patch-repair endonuclease
MTKLPHTSEAWAALSTKQREASLRARATPSEIQLKNMLNLDPRTRSKFKFQAACCGYFVDFLCAKQKLVIELDGAVHSSPAARIADAKRTRKLALKGYRVVRFWNGELRQPTHVLCRILNALALQSPMPESAQQMARELLGMLAPSQPTQPLDLESIIVSTRTRRRAGVSV